MVSDKTVAFAKKFGSGPLYEHHTTSLIFNDPPYHTTVRKLLARAFTPRKLAEMEPLIEDIVDGLLATLTVLAMSSLLRHLRCGFPPKLSHLC